MRTDFICKKQHIPRLKSIYESSKDKYAIEVDAYTELRDFIKEQENVIQDRIERMNYENEMHVKNVNFAIYIYCVFLHSFESMLFI